MVEMRCYLVSLRGICLLLPMLLTQKFMDLGWCAGKRSVLSDV